MKREGTNLLRRGRTWLDERTGYRALLRHLIEEPLPNGTGWAFTTGSILLFLIAVQVLTGIVLSMYYVPAPALAYDSVRFITSDLTNGFIVRGLHFWGASFIVVAAVVHMLRVFFFGSYKAPREVTWITGVVLLLLILAFALTGYLLPWDQKAYWATTVTINIARGTPFIGEYVADVMRGGTALGALTLGRWYSAHVFLLPAAMLLFVVSHIALMRRHGISGPLRVHEGLTRPFYPWHAIKDTLVIAGVFALLLTFAVKLPATLDDIANPADASYVPRPEWYFLGLFQLLKYFPGPLEPVATMVIPGLIVGFLLALPFVDRSRERHPFARARVPVTVAMLLVGSAAVLLTVLGFGDTAERTDPNDWGPRAIAGYDIAMSERSVCATCHVTGGPAAELAHTRITKDDEWLLAHMADPVAIGPGVRSEEDPAPEPAMTRLQAQSVVAYLRKVRGGARAPQSVSAEDHLAAGTFSAMCISCHRIAGDGGTTGPDLSKIGAKRSAVSIRQLIADPKGEFPDTVMPTFRDRLNAHQIDALAKYLARRK
jgi:ubiquinol-cytochrome c reductase cytochrome b subunit